LVLIKIWGISNSNMTFTIEELTLIQTALELRSSSLYHLAISQREHRNHLYKKNMEKVEQIDKIVNRIVDYKSKALQKM
jgi:DNA-dependent RNA polymerase auxiliary subunit epsilon